jgi:hypothetical protein
MSEAKKGKTLSEETKAKISTAQGTAITVMDKETAIISTYTSINRAAKVYGVTQQALSYHFKKTNSFVLKGRYLFEKVDIEL